MKSASLKIVVSCEGAICSFPSTVHCWTVQDRMVSLSIVYQYVELNTFGG